MRARKVPKYAALAPTKARKKNAYMRYKLEHDRDALDSCTPASYALEAMTVDGCAQKSSARDGAGSTAMHACCATLATRAR
jgi:hypothetical protein